MFAEPPTSPAELPTDPADTHNRYSAEQLQHVGRYVEALASLSRCGTDADRITVSPAVGFILRRKPWAFASCYCNCSTGRGDCDTRFDILAFTGVPPT